MATNPNVLAHLEWLGFVQPTGLVVSAQALDACGVVLNRNDAAGQADQQRRLARTVVDRRTGDDTEKVLTTFEDFARTVLGWSFAPQGFVGMAGTPVPDDLAISLPDEGGTLAPRYAVRDLAPSPGTPAFQLLVLEFPVGHDLDRPYLATGRYDASPSSRLERLLRETGVGAGLACNGTTIRLMAAPRGETSGWIDFRIDHMLTAAGRAIGSAMRLLLDQQRLLTGAPEARLAALLRASRDYQSGVSERLAGQVLAALYELVRGAQAARSAKGGDPIAALVTPATGDAEAARLGKETLYQGLLTVVMRLLFQLYAEERDLAFADGTPSADYAVGPLHARLREDAALHPDTMDHRHGAWARLLALWRLTHGGAPDLGAVPRHGSLFDPDRFPFLEGRHAPGDPVTVPLIPDGTIHRVLELLLVLDGERLSYRALDVEHVGSVYEAMMGFRIEVATGTSVAIRGDGPLGAPVTVALEEVLAQAPAARAAWLEAQAGRAPTGAALAALRQATTVDDAHGALERLVDRRATPDRVPAGALVMQPSEARRTSGSHYTPRDLTRPIVARTRAPVLDRLRPAAGVAPTPGAILDLAVCDPAMGSAAFLVEACRFLGDALVQAWAAHGGRPPIPADEDEVAHARRLVAQRCLYGVDRNPMAVELAKVSLWLATLARAHPLTFIDHALRHGDSLVGLTRTQVERMDWDASATPLQWLLPEVGEAFDALRDARQRIRDAGDDVGDATKRRLWDAADRATADVRRFGDLATGAFFDAATPRARKAALEVRTFGLQGQRGDAFRADLEARRHAARPLVPFHWELEFPEVFGRPHPGFDAIVGNPPFAGKNTVASGNPPHYLGWLQALHEGSHGNADLVAHFFRRAFGLLRPGGAFGLIATNTIAQGDTRSSGLRWICTHGGEIYHATRRLPWPGMAAVVVSVVHLWKGAYRGDRHLDGEGVPAISAFLVPGTAHDDPARLQANAARSFVGSYVLGMGFTFEPGADDDVGDGPPGTPTSYRRMHELLAAHPHYAEVVQPYLGGAEVNGSPTHAYRRHVINFGDRSEAECRERYPGLMAIVEAKVKPERDRTNREGYRKYWWQFGEKRADLRITIAGLDRVLVNSRVGQHGAFAFLPVGTVYSEQLVVFPFRTHAAFAALQARPHELWARAFGSSLGDCLRYTPSDCFETFPFPEGWEDRADLEAPGREYYEFRAALMVRNGEGLTATYNRFHDPLGRDPAIVALRRRHDAMDRAVLDAYGWADLPVACDFFPEHEAAAGDDEDAAAGRARPRTWRYRWPDAVREEVLGRLLALNATRAQDETRRGAGAARPRGRPRGPGAPGAMQGRLV